MEKWKISAEIDSTLSGMDMSQIAELATAIMDTWAPASTELISSSSQGLGVQPTDSQQVNKVFGTTIKQEVAAVPNEYEYPGTIPLPAYYQGVTTISEQVPMDDYDPLESFSFWDGENFYTTQDMEGCGPSGTCDMQMDSSTMPTLPEYLGEDDLTHDDGFPVKDFDPTLAELNSCGDTGFEFSVNSSFLSEDSSFPLLSDNLSKSFPESHFVASPVSTSSHANSSFSSGINYIPTGFIDIKPNIQPPSLSSSCPVPSRLIPSNNSQFLNPYEEKFLICPQNSPAAETFFPAGAGSVEPKQQVVTKPRGIASPLIANRLQDSNLLSSSAPPDVTMSSYFAKIKTEPIAHSPGRRSVTERSLSGFESLSLSNDDESGSFFDDDEEEHDDEEEYSSDEDIYQYDSDDVSPNWPGSKEEKTSQPRKHRYFWQYNLQSRGAKTHNILPRLETTDPHILNDAFDPVFSEDCTLPVKHSGKARRGDGNDLTPDPRKLYNIGMELKKLNKLIYNVNPEGTGHGKPLSRKEKNKLASRVCRLKKKAQHEANKIKLYGLQKEHKKLLFIIMDTKELLKYKIENLQEKKLSNCSKKLETFLAANEPRRVAGNTAAFVNEVLEKVAKGDSDGGLSRL